MIVVIGKPEHPGRVQVVGSGHTIRSVYGPSKHSSSSKEMFRMFKTKLTKAKAQLSYPNGQSTDTDIGPKKCQLLVDGVDDPVIIDEVFHVSKGVQQFLMWLTYPMRIVDDVGR
ncbi:hypothetical protein RJT34_30485 [Clitoria ternatea]|uniref:Uncharacterized protein n=1 Tax=Clitoria ternatea TaxID=43366 RepID=A0AAN9ESH4_CLITE